MKHALDPTKLALVVIDPQTWTLGPAVAPHPHDAIAANVARLADQLNRAGGVTVFTRAAFSSDLADMLNNPVDVPLQLPPGGLSENAVAFHEKLKSVKPTVVITKRQWSAFYGTELDLQLRRRHIDTVMVCGVMTNFGVESTARDAWQLNYSVLVIEDLCSSVDPLMHTFAIEKILPRVSRVRSSRHVMDSIASATRSAA